MKPYKLPQNYINWKDFDKHRSMFASVKPKPINLYGAPSVLENLAYLYLNWSQGYPLYCVRQSLLDDMLATDVGEKLELFSDIRLAVPCYALFFPKKSVKTPNKEGFIDYLIVKHEELSLEEHKHLISWGGVNSSGGLVLSYKRIRRDGTLQRSHFSSDDKEEQQIALNIRNIVLQSTLFLQYCPDLVETITQIPATTKGFGLHKANDSQYLLPRWLGKEREKSYKSSNGSSGTGSSKAPHFRRGFFRRQPVGEGRKNVEIVWVRPSYVNAEGKSE